jgi:hypothetical protein
MPRRSKSQGAIVRWDLVYQPWETRDQGKVEGHPVGANRVYFVRCPQGNLIQGGAECRKWNPGQRKI